MSANDPDDFIRPRSTGSACRCARTSRYLGICLGAQMLARHLGERVFTHPEGKAEVGYYPVQPTPAGARSATGRTMSISGIARASTCRAAPSCWPKATSSARRRSATAPAYAIQFHAEVTHAMMCRWTTRGHARMEMPGAKPRHEHFADRPVYDHGIRAWLADFLDHWLDGGTAAQLAAAE